MTKEYGRNASVAAGSAGMKWDESLIEFYLFVKISFCLEDV